MLRRSPFLQCTLALLTCTALLVSLSACDTLNSFSNEDDPDVELGHFEMVLSGAVTDTLEGRAVFSTTTMKDTTGEEREIFGLAFLPDTSETEEDQGPWFASQILRASTQPESGEHAFANLFDPESFPDDPFFPDDLLFPSNPFFPDDPFVPSETFAFSFLTEGTTHSAAVLSEGGTLTLTTSSSARIAGTFSVDASGSYYKYNEMERPQGGSLTIEGTFNAIGGASPTQ